MLPQVELYSDGGSNPNPGVGGYGIILRCQGKQKEFYQGFEMTTNNRMEMTGVITGLSKLTRKSSVTVYTDSQYTINGIEKGWAKKWKENNWYRTKSEKAVNFDLWGKLLDLISQHEVTFQWVKGHNGHLENERCDELATLAMDMTPLLIDEGFIPKENTDQLSLDTGDKKAKTLSGNPKLKIQKEGDPCKKCLTPVIKKKPKHTKKTLEKKYYYEYFFSCSNCKTNYMTNEAKRDIGMLKI